MNLRTVYLLAAVAGAVAPYVFFVGYFAANGLSPIGFIEALFVNGAAGGFTVDLLVSSVVFWVFVFVESTRTGVRRPWLFVVLNLTIGLSCALPAFLFARTGALNGK